MLTRPVHPPLSNSRLFFAFIFFIQLMTIFFLNAFYVTPLHTTQIVKHGKSNYIPKCINFFSRFVKKK